MSQTTDKTVLRLTLPLPPSANNAYSNVRRGGRILTAEARRYKDAVQWQALAAGARTAKLRAPYSLSLIVYFASTRRSDISNRVKLAWPAKCGKIERITRTGRRGCTRPAPANRLGAVDMANLSNSAKRIPDEVIVDAYENTGNVWRAGEIAECSGQTVHARLVKLGIPRSYRYFTEDENQVITRFYDDNADTPNDQFDLTSLAEHLNRHKSTISGQAKKLGLTRQGRAWSNDAKAAQSEAQSAWIADNGHPRGMLGKRHTPETRAKRAEDSALYWSNITPEQLEARRIKARRTRLENGSTSPNNPGGGGYKHVKRGRREDLGFFVRSAWEANWARYLQFLVDNASDPLEHYEYEPETFWFDPIKRGSVSYTPDFKLYERGKEPYFQEVKGRMDQKSRTKLKRMAKYHPDVRLDLIDEKAYREVERKLGAAIPNWEFSG